MELWREIDGYCERMDPGYWAEPVNALTNAAFVLAALIMWRRSHGVPMARGLCVVLGLIGVGSYLFHTHAQVWAAILDVTPILGYILIYIFAVNRDVWGMPVWVALLGTALFIPYAALTVPLWQGLPVLGVSAGYMPVPMLIAIYAVLLWRRYPKTARGLLIGVGILLVSLTARSVDETLCADLPLGTHFIWHVLNAVMLGWMIEVYVRHIRAHALEGVARPR
ncbi:ceramidase domain-containing protein [Tateyamaria armeniaca]|uniref:Ceramidase domain-containing protein n=1 Tax=Tateyamaria armeniaca TaxID=2518930 RepID=A0ABW8UY12_9RHOB